MVVKEDKQRLHRLLADAIPLLCKSGLPLKATFCIEALIGITLEDDEVMLISFKQEIRADQSLPRGGACEPTAADGGDTAMAGRGTVTKASFIPVAERRKDRKDRQTDDELSDGPSGRYAGKIFPRGEGMRASPRSGDLSIVKVENVDFKMEEDVEMIASSCNFRSEAPDDSASDGRSWNFGKYNTFPTPGLKICAKEAVPGSDECAGGLVTQGSWKGDNRRTGNKIGRKRIGQSSNGSVSHDERGRTPTPPDIVVWHRRRKDGRSGSVLDASPNPGCLSYAGGDANHDWTVCDSSAEKQDSSVNQSISDIQLTDDRISLEQTCKILSSYRFASSDDNLYSCHICEAKLRGRQTLNEHIRGTHLCAHIYQCSNCGTSFKWRSGLQRHRSRCTAPTTAEAQVPKTDETQVLMAD